MLNNNKPFSLGKNERLKKRKAIDLLFVKGKAFTLFPFKVVYQLDPIAVDEQPQNDMLQAAFSVSKRFFKKAVHRNRIKRLLKECYRLQKPELKLSVQKTNCQLKIFIIYLGKELPEHLLVETKMKALLKRLQKITDEETIANP